MAKDFLEHFLQNYMVPILGLLLFILVIIIIYYRLRFAYLSYRKRQYYTKISDAITTLTFSGLEGELLKNEVEKFKSQFPYHKKWFKRLLLSSLLDLNLNLKGDLIYQIREIYMAFELHKHSLKLIIHPHWSVKCIGINQFQAMNFVHGQKYIKPYMTSKNTILRSNAYIAHLYLTTESFDTLVDYPNPLSRVNEYKVIDILYLKNDPIPKNIDRWLEAKNDSIVILGLKIMVFYNYSAAPNEIMALLNHETYRIREEAILSIRELFLIDAEEALQTQFHKEDKLLKIELLKSLAIIGSKSSVLFITHVLKIQDTDKDVKMELLRSLKSIDFNYYDSRFMMDLDIESMKEHLNSAYL